MYGKVFASMFEGSLVGKGAIAFAVMGYAIAKAHPVKDRMQVTLNPNLIAASLGEAVESIKETIDFLCAPDPDSTTKDEEGRRLVKIGSFEYWLVNGMKYRDIRDEEQRREQLRVAQATFRRKKKCSPAAGHVASEKMIQNGLPESDVDAYQERLNAELRREIGLEDPPTD